MGKGTQDGTSGGAPATAGGRQRLDKWLWFARVVKSRTLAAKLVSEGHVRINAVRQDAPARAVIPGDVLTISLEREVKVLKVQAPGVRRGPYEEARLLYEDMTPPRETVASAANAGLTTEPGAGRPTKKDRRELDRWQGGDKWTSES